MSQDRVADYDRAPQGTILFGERFRLLVPPLQGIFSKICNAPKSMSMTIFF
jgi:hypothetical protein